MTSPAQIEANRANAQNSTGPATAAGKAIVRLNATRHGLTSQIACMTWEDRDAFNRFCAALVADYHPEGPAETQFAQSIAEDHWRLNRARAIEQNVFALGFSTFSDAAAVESDNPQIDAALAQARTFRDEAKTFGLITLYEQRINRNLQRNLDRLRQSQAERREARAQALGELLELREFDKLRGRSAVRTGDSRDQSSGPIPDDIPDEVSSRTEAPGEVNGFVFSPGEIEIARFRRRRSNLLAVANQLASGRTHSRSSHRFEDAA